MHTFRLEAPDTLNPFWLSKVRHGSHAALAGERDVVLYGETLRFKSDAPASGSPVEVWIGADGFFVCATVVSVREAVDRQRALEVAQATARNAALDTARNEAQAFNARIRLPVTWAPGIKDVLAGLSEASWGDGRNSATVEHIYLLEDLNAGRFRRNQGDFLCTAASGANGKRWSGTVAEKRIDGQGNTYPAKVTCRACLALAQRWVAEPDAEDVRTETVKMDFLDDN